MSGRRSQVLSRLATLRGVPGVVAVTLTGLLGALLYVAPEVVAPVAAAAATTTPTGLLTAPDEASARASAKLSGQRVQVDSELTGSSTTYVNPDGTVTTDSFAARSASRNRTVRGLTSTRPW